jgi:hypothetical protein
MRCFGPGVRPGFSSDIPLLHAVQPQGLPILQKAYSPRDLSREVRETLDLRLRKLVTSASQF